VSQLKGIIVNVTDHFVSKDPSNDWTLQVITVRNNAGINHDVKIWNRPDLSREKGKMVELDGCVAAKDKQNRDCLQIKKNQGSIETFDAPKPDKPDLRPVFPANTGSSPAPAYSVPTQTEYEAVLTRAVRVVTDAFLDATNDKSFLPAPVDQQAVAEVVKGYLVAYSKGDFIAERVVTVEKIKEAVKLLDAGQPDDYPL
jgi:hypothetical protein